MEILSTLPITMNEVSDKVKKQSDTTYSVDIETQYLNLLDMETISIYGIPYSISNWAMAQLCNKFALPYTYLKKCYTKDYELAKINFERWATLCNRQVKFRIYNNKIVGAVSDKYTFMTNNELLNSLNEVDDLTGMTIRNHIITPERLHIRFTEDKPILDDLYCGISVDNSETGKSSLCLKFFVYKQLCTNGLILRRLESNIFVKKHLGYTNETVESIKKGLYNLPTFKETAKQLIEESMTDTLTQREMTDTFNNLIARHLLSQQAIDSTSIDYFIQRYGRTRWALANIITELSQKFTLDTRLTLEDCAGQLIS